MKHNEFRSGVYHHFVGLYKRLPRRIDEHSSRRLASRLHYRLRIRLQELSE